MQQTQSSRDVEAPVAALGHVLFVPQREHEAMARFGVFTQGEASTRGPLAPSKIGERGRNDVEGDTIGTLLQCWQHLFHFDITAGPAVAEEQGHGVGGVGGLVDVVNVEFFEVVDFDSAVVLRELVQFGFLGAPVEPILPVPGEPFDVSERRAVVPRCAGELVRECRC